MIDVDYTTVQMLQVGLESMACIHETTLRPTSRCHCDEANRLKEQEARSETHFDEGRSDIAYGINKMYAVENTVRHIGSGPASGTWLDGTGLARWSTLSKHPTTYRNTSARHTGDDSTSGEGGNHGETSLNNDPQHTQPP